MRFSRLLAFVILGMGATPGNSQEFRIDTDVLVGKDPNPVAQHVTVFTQSAVYDFALPGPSEVTMLDIQGGKILLLDVENKAMAKVPTVHVLQFARDIKLRAEKSKSGLLDFQVSYDEAARTLELRGNPISYSSAGMPAEQPTAITRYREFADWHARLNAMRPGNTPPFGRLQLNRELAERKLMPELISRKVVVSRLTGKSHRVSSKHAVAWQLTNTDRRRIQDVAGYIATFDDVPWRDYLGIDQAAVDRIAERAEAR